MTYIQAQNATTDATKFKNKLAELITEAELAGTSGFVIVETLASAAAEHPATRYRFEMRIRRLNAEAEASWCEPDWAAE
jgi:hypothetical protein